MPYDNEMRGVLFPAEKKTDKHPDYTGTMTIHGEEFRLAGWKRISKDGTKSYLSISVTVPLEKQALAENNNRPALPLNDDEIPF